MKHIILGTAGHIDHGKTALIKGLTGTDTDRLKEEKLRGITIELGFASLTLPSGQSLGIIDVPGHERFVKNMVAGASTVDIVALVIAADEGVMPQTREHLEICQLLQVKMGLVVLTKIDMVDEEWLELVTEDVREFLEGTFLEDAPIVPVSSATGEGYDRLIEELDRLAAATEERTRVGVYRLPIDRVFTMKGFGTVVTGTSVSGAINLGDPITIYPEGVESKIRGLQVHSEEVEQASAGLRTAINLQGVEKEAIYRGDVLASANSLVLTKRLDAYLSLLKSMPRPLKNRTRVRFHTGTAEILAEVTLLDRDEARPGDTIFVQLHLEHPTTVLPRDRYVVRSYSPVHTIGGGEILAVSPPKHKRNRPDVLTRLEVFKQGTPAEFVSALIEQSGIKGLSRNDLARMTPFTKNVLDTSLQQLQSDREVLQFTKEPPTFIHARIFNEMKGKIVEVLDQYHQRYPLRPGMNKQELCSQLPYADVRLFNFVLTSLTKEDAVQGEQEEVHLSSHKVLLKEDEQEFRKKLEDTYLKAGLTPPYFKDLQDRIPPDVMKEVLSHLLGEKVLIKVKEGLYFHQQPLAELKDKLVEYLKTHGEVSTPEFKDMTGVSRKYTIPLFEYFDSQQVTMRVGEKRVLRTRK